MSCSTRRMAMVAAFLVLFLIGGTLSQSSSISPSMPNLMSTSTFDSMSSSQPVLGSESTTSTVSEPMSSSEVQPCQHH
ncbi:hypothetical protein OS493_035052 [Desmophyllum pertusum]|uniref:Uncharacterized protein n=1 Tax=Desmophyllum pertusum TaxID=174260 RepID=A0A9X0D6S5_9CNID|nr:hypothetical protein OS493_035052 [Desmophyllum pertusum]